MEAKYHVNHLDQGGTTVTIITDDEHITVPVSDPNLAKEISTVLNAVIAKNDHNLAEDVSLLFNVLEGALA